jgi:hypothetical protein
MGGGRAEGARRQSRRGMKSWLPTSTVVNFLQKYLCAVLLAFSGHRIVSIFTSLDIFQWFSISVEEKVYIVRFISLV